MLPPMHCFSSLQALNNVVLYQVYHSLISRKNKTFQQLKAKSRFFDVFVFCLIFQQTDITLMILNEDITRVRKKITFKMIQILLYFPSPELSFLVFLYKPLFLLKIRWGRGKILSTPCFKSYNTKNLLRAHTRKKYVSRKDDILNYYSLKDNTIFFLFL